MDFSTINSISRSVNALSSVLTSGLHDINFGDTFLYFRNHGIEDSLNPILDRMRENVIASAQESPILNELYINMIEAHLNEPPQKNPVPDHIVQTLPIKKIDENIIENSESCVVCMNHFSLNEDVLILPCKHTFHVHCIKTWFQEQNVCPICRLIIYEDGERSNLTNQTENIFSSDSDSIFSNELNSSEDMDFSDSESISSSDSFNLITDIHQDVELADVFEHLWNFYTEDTFNEVSERFRERLLQNIRETSPFFNIYSEDADILEASLNEPPKQNPIPDHVIEGLAIEKMSQELIEKIDSCVICREKFSLNDEVLVLFCTHPFHKNCITSWFKEQNICPICRFIVYEEKNEDEMEIGHNAHIT